MIIINAMFGRKLGGIEQCFVDYSEALVKNGHQVYSIIRPNSKIKKDLERINSNIVEINNYGHWDLLAKIKLQNFAKKVGADAIICHGNRAARLFKQCKKTIPIIGITHNYFVKHLIGMSAIIALTDDLKKHVTKLGQNKKTIYRLPNMVASKPYKAKKTSSPIIIGTMGRFIEKKGIDCFIKALAILEQRGVNFKAVIGGGGPIEQDLKKLSHSLNLNNKIEFLGWIKNKDQFFEQIDIFCLPSYHEPFGIIVLEAFANSIPSVVTDSGGPGEIAKDKKEALIVQPKNQQEMADKLEQLINDQKLRETLGKNANKLISEKYSMEVVGKGLHDIVTDVAGRG